MSPITLRMWQQVVTLMSFELRQTRSGFLQRLGQHAASRVSPEHGLPGVQDPVVAQPGGRRHDLGEQQPGPGGVIGFSVRHEVGDEGRRELALFGPDGEGPAEIPAEDPRQNRRRSRSVIRSFWFCSLSRPTRSAFLRLQLLSMKQRGCPTSGSGTRHRAGPAGPRSASGWRPGGGRRGTASPG